MPRPLRTNLNLLPLRYRRRSRIRAGLTLWAGIWTAGLLLGSFGLWQADRGSESVRRELSRYQRLYAPTQVMAQEVVAMRRRLIEVRAEERAVASLEDDRPVLAVFGILGEAAQACQERLQVRECNLEQSAQSSTAPGTTQLLTIKGVALDLSCVTRFQVVLRDAGMFDRVDLKPTTSTQIGAANGYLFHVECRYQ